MKVFNKHIFNSIITCVLLVLVCLSCPIKRGIKQDIGILLSKETQLNKHTAQASCSAYRKTGHGQPRFLSVDPGTAGSRMVTPAVFEVAPKGNELSNLNRKIGLGVYRTLFILYRKILI